MHPSDIKIGQNVYRAYQLIDFIKEGRLKLEQKKKWDNRNMSMSIESVLLGLTMTPIYIDASNPESWFVLDGRKRLQALSNFFEGKFALTDLDFFPDYNGKFFYNLPFPLQTKLAEATFTVYSINQGVSERVRLNLVLRIVPDLKSALSWEFKESLIDPSLKKILDKWNVHPDMDFVINHFKPKSDYQLVLEYFRLYYTFNDFRQINLSTSIEHVIFQLNTDMDLPLEEWDLGIVRVSRIFESANSLNANLYLNKRTIPIFIFYFGTLIDNRLFEIVINDKGLFLNKWKRFYSDGGKKLFVNRYPKLIYSALDKLIKK